MTERDLFLAALEVPTDERGRFLDERCEGNAELRGRVEALLVAHAVSGGFLDRPSVSGSKRQSNDPSPAPPAAGVPANTVIAGRYKLLKPIGEGGMGSVWLAEQTEPVKRQVAVKLVRAERGGSSGILARFEAERQAIALMDHPNIARLFDAGTDSGGPYFVMELVKGVPIADYCDQHRLNVRDRLVLFGNVCQAVQHAHQKGVIHRDLKPSNVLVEQQDGRPVPKVIDFGLAKATGGLQLTENTLFTGFGAVLGTPLYMAPEQATFNSVDVDTRADVYALGVILYELLTGTTPIDRKQLGKAALDEFLRVIREEEPPTPSSRLSTSDGTPSAAAVRGTEPAQLGRLIKGDLDWVVMKALAKDRDRRYESAGSFGQDLERFLNHEPVAAGPPSTIYRMRKFVRRNRKSVAAAGFLFLALLGGLIGTGWGLIKAREATVSEREAKDVAKWEKQVADEQRQVAEAVRDFLQTGLLGQADVIAQADALLAVGGPVAIARPGVTVRELLDRATEELTESRLAARFPNQPLVHAGLLQTAGQAYVGLGIYDKGLPLLRRAVSLKVAHLGADDRLTLIAHQQLANACFLAGKPAEAVERSNEVVQRMTAVLGASDRETLNARNTLATSLLENGRTAEALAVFEALVPELETVLGPKEAATLAARTGFAKATRAAGQRDRAFQLYRQAYDAKRVALGPDHPTTLLALSDLAVGAEEGGKPGEALPLYEEAYRLSSEVFGPKHRYTLIAGGNLSGAYDRRGQLKRALELGEEIVRRSEEVLGPDHPDTFISLSNLAGYLGKSGENGRAITLLERVVAGRIKVLGADHPDVLQARSNLAIALGRVGKWEPAAVELETVLAERTAKLGADHPNTLSTRSNLAYTYLNHGPPDRAVATCEEAVRRTTSALGAKSPEALKAREYLAAAYQQVGRPADAVTVQKPLLTDLTASLGPDHPTTRGMQASLGSMLLDAGRFAEAEPILRDVLVTREKAMPADWRTANARSLLGAALMGQKKFAEAEPLLVAGYNGLKGQKPSAIISKRQGEVLDRLIALAEATGKPEMAAKWRAERAKLTGTEKKSPK